MYALGIHVDEELIRTYVAADRLDICIIVVKQLSGEFNVKCIDCIECMQGKKKIVKKGMNLQS